MNKIIELKPLKKERRFFASAIDLILSLIIGILLFEFAFFPAFSSNSSFLNCEIEANEIRKEITNLYKSSRAKAFNENNEPLENSYLYLEFIGEFKEEKVSCLEHFYLDFAKSNYEEYKEVDKRWFNVNVLGLPAKDEDLNYSYFFTYKTDGEGNRLYDEIGIFNKENNFLTNLNYYLDGKMFEDSSNAFQELYSRFNKKVEAEVKIIENSAFYKEKYERYSYLENQISYTYSKASIVSFLISTVLIYLVLPNILKKRTLGEVICRLKTINLNETQASYFKINLRNFLRMVSIFPFFLFMPIFKINIILCFTMIILIVDEFSLNALSVFIVSIIILLSDLFMMIYKKDGLSLIGFISRTKTISSIEGETKIIDDK